MKKIGFIFFSLLLLSSTKANAITLQGLLTFCTDWEKYNFSSQAQIFDRADFPSIAGCSYYMGAWRDAAAMNCSFTFTLENFLSMADMSDDLRKQLDEKVPEWVSFGAFDNLTEAQLAQMTLNFARAHPEHWNSPAVRHHFEVVDGRGKCS